MGLLGRVAVVVLVATTLLFPSAEVAAHGAAPEATGLLAVAGEQATLVRLSRGLALRTAGGFRFLCPEAWGGDVTAPMAAMGSGALVAGEALYIIESDGRVSAHPTQAGVGVALVSHDDGAYGIFLREGQRELRRVTRATNELRCSLDEAYTQIAASDGALWLLRWADKNLVLQSILPSGDLGQRSTFTASSVVARAELRAVAGRLYVVIWGSAAPWVTLGQVTERGYEALRDGHSDIAGPIVLGGGTYAAIDGVLEQVELRLAVGASAHLSCLETRGVLSYACAPRGLTRVEPTGLGAPMFELSSLREPDYAGLDEVQRADCRVRWLDLRDHIAETAQVNAFSDAAVAAGSVGRGAAADASMVDDPLAGDTGSPGCRLIVHGTRSGSTTFVTMLVLFAIARAIGRSKVKLGADR